MRKTALNHTNPRNLNSYERAARGKFFAYIAAPKRIVFLVISFALIFGLMFEIMDIKNAYAAPGINETINFQGKVVNSNGTNVADGQYTFVFKLYDAPSGGSNPWTETQNNVTVTGGIFRVSLGSVTPITGVDFNSDNIYLGINFNSDGEMTPRVRFASVPYAFNAQKVAGLTVTTTTGTLTIPNSKTIQFGGSFTTSAQDLILTLSGSTDVTLPTTGTLATLGGIENLSNKSFTSTVTFSGITTDITTGSNEDFSVAPAGTGKVNINTTSGTGSFNVRPNSVSGGTLSVASISGSTAFAALLVDNSGSGDIFTASTAGVPKFVIRNSGQIYSSHYTANGGILYGQSNGVIGQTSVGNNGECLKSIGGGSPTWGGCSTQGSNWVLNTNSGTLSLINNTLDLLVGGSSTSSAVLKVTGQANQLSGTLVGASISANTSFAGFVIDNKGVGDIFTASQSGMTQLVLTGNGSFGLGLGAGLRPTAKLDVNGSASISGVLSFRNGTGTISTTGENSLIIGGAETGNILINPTATSRIGIGTGVPLATLDIRGNYSFGGGTLAVASVSGTTSFATLAVDNFGAGDLFTASSSSNTQFVIRNNGAVGIGNAARIPTAQLDVAGAASIASTLTFRNGSSNIQSSQNNTLTVGGNMTGDISFRPGNTNALYLASNGSIGFNGSFGTAQNCLISMGTSASPIWGNCATGPGQWWNLNAAQGTTYSINTTLDTLFGGTSTASAGFRIAGGTKDYGTKAAASVSANTSFAGLVVDNRGSGDLLTASSSGMTRFTIFNSGNVLIGNGPDSGFKLDVEGSVRIGNNNQTNDISKQTSSDFTVSGYSVTSSDGVNTVSTSGNQLKLVTDVIGAGGTPNSPAADQTTGANVTTGSVAFQRPDKKFVVYVGGAVTSRIYDPETGLWGSGPSTNAALGAGARAFQRQNGSFLIIRGGAQTTTNIYSPGGSTNLGTVVAGPATTGNVGVGSQIIRRTDGKVLVIHGNTSTTTSVHDPVVSAGTTSILGTFITGPATTGNVVAGSFVFQSQNGKWIVGLGGGTTTNVYDPSSPGVGGGGAFSAGPSLTAGAPGAGTHVIQLPDGRYMVLIGGSTATQIYDSKTNTFSAGSTMSTAIGAGSHSFQRSDGKWVVVVGGNSTSLMLYDPVSGANGTFSNLASGLSASAGAGSITFQRPDGQYIVVHGNSAQTTTLYDAGWNTTGTWTSEDILSTKISTYSAMFWTANPQSANNNARLDADTISFEVKTGDTLTSLGNNPYVSIQDSGGLIKAYGNAQYAKIRVTFTAPIRSYPSGATGIISQTNIWEGEGGLFYRRSFIQPTVSNIKIQNPLVMYGDQAGGGDPSFGRNFATASAVMEGVATDNSNRLTLQTLRNTPTASASAGILIASASANLTGNAGAGSHTIERNSGQFLVIHGNSLTTTSVYDPDTNTFTPGPTLPNAAGAGAHSFLLPDGRFFVVLGGTTNKTAILDTQSNVFLAGPNLYGNVGIGANTFQRPDGLFVILNGGGTNATNILDPFTMAVTQGPFTVGVTPNVGAGSLNIRRQNGRILVVLGNNNAVATATNIYDLATNSFAAGPALVGGTVNTGGNAIQLDSGRVIVFKSTATSNYLDPIQNTFAAGAAATANGAGSFLIPRSDGKIFKANGGNAATTNIYDPQANSVLTGTSAPTLPCNVNTGGHVFQRTSGEYVAICGGGTATTLVIDAGWNLGGTYTTEQIQVPDLSSTSSVFWKNAGKGTITVKYRTASSRQALGVAEWKDVANSGAQLSPAAGDTWAQFRFDLQGFLQDAPGAKSRVWNASDSGGNMVYYRAVQAPILQYWKLANIQDPSILTLTSGSSNVFRFSADGQAFTSDNGAWNSGGADLAERYSSKESLEAGEVVTIDRFNPQHTKRATIPYDSNAMGVVSTQPGFVAGAFTQNSYPIALVGRVPVKVSTENGQIKAGDYLTPASIPGYAMKATVAGRVLGQAMEDFDPANSQEAVDCPNYGAGSLNTTQCGTVTVFVNLTSYNGESVKVAMTESGYQLVEGELPLISGIDFAVGTDERRQQEVLGFLREQRDNGQELYTDRLSATQEVISPQIITDLLVAKRIKAESIEGLEILTNSIDLLSNRVATASSITNFSDKLTQLSDNQDDLERTMASLSARLEKIGNLNLIGFASESQDDNELTIVNNFASYGTTTLSEVSVLNSLTIGSGTAISITGNAIDAVGADLSIQSLKQGAVSFLSGLIRFETDGKANFFEDVTFGKNVAVAGVLSARTVSTADLKLSQGDVKILSNTEVEATGAAGLVTIKKDEDFVKVYNPQVKDTSLIFITPKSRTRERLFLLEQSESKEGEMGSFTVELDSKAADDIKFNFLIVN